MDLKISSQFANDFKSLGDASLHTKMKNVLNDIKTAKNITDISQFKKISGKAYKMGIGFYYIVGIISSQNEITLLRLLDRDQVLASIK